MDPKGLPADETAPILGTGHIIQQGGYMKTWQLYGAGFCLGLMLTLQGCTNTVPAGFVCPKTFGDYKPGVINSAEVKQCMGDPVHEDHNPDGRYIYMYESTDGTIVAFLFDSSDKLIRVNGYVTKK